MTSAVSHDEPVRTERQRALDIATPLVVLGAVVALVSAGRSST